MWQCRSTQDGRKSTQFEYCTHLRFTIKQRHTIWTTILSSHKTIFINLNNYINAPCTHKIPTLVYYMSCPIGTILTCKLHMYLIDFEFITLAFIPLSISWAQGCQNSDLDLTILRFYDPTCPKQSGSFKNLCDCLGLVRS